MDSDNKRISQLTQITSLNDSDAFVVSIDIPSAPKTRGIYMTYIKAALVAAYALIAKGGANLKMFMNAAGTSAEWANGMKIGTFTYDTATASGNQAITGVGFKPSIIVVLANVGPTPETSIGFSDGTNHLSLFNSTNIYGANTWATAGASCISLFQSASISAIGSITTLGSDGFTIAWTKAGAKTGTATIIYLAFR